MQSTKISSATDVWSSKMVNTSVSSSQSQEEWATVLLCANFNSIGIEDELKLKPCKGHLQTCRPWICASVNQTGHSGALFTFRYNRQLQVLLLSHSFLT